SSSTTSLPARSRSPANRRTRTSMDTRLGDGRLCWRAVKGPAPDGFRPICWRRPREKERRMKFWRRGLVLAGAVLGAGALAACGSSSSSSNVTPTGTTPVVKADPSVQKLVPAAIKSKGTLVVASDASYAPNEFVGPDGHTVIGMDPDLVTALGAVMGLKAKV